MAREKKKPDWVEPALTDETAGIETEPETEPETESETEPETEPPAAAAAVDKPEDPGPLVMLIRDVECPGPSAVEVFASEVAVYVANGWRRADGSAG